VRKDRFRIQAQETTFVTPATQLTPSGCWAVAPPGAAVSRGGREADGLFVNQEGSS